MPSIPHFSSAPADPLLAQMPQLLSPSVVQPAVPPAMQSPMPNNAAVFDAQKLADIQLPEAIGLWPPAPGWWLLLVLILLLLWLIIYFIRRKPVVKKATVKQLKKQAMTEFHQLNTHYRAHQDDNETAHQTVRELSVFLRRYVLSLYSREKVASLTDKQWLKLLDNTYNSQFSSSFNSFSKNSSTDAKNDNREQLFSKKYAPLLTTAPYQSSEQFIDPVLLRELLASTEILIRKSARLFIHKRSTAEYNRSNANV